MIALQPAVRFHLLADLPLEAVSRIVTDRLEIAQVPVRGMWQLKACYDQGCARCMYRASDAELRKAVHVEGLALEGATVTWVISERLVKEGRAEIMRE
jgi:hypothetical protein